MITVWILLRAVVQIARVADAAGNKMEVMSHDVPIKEHNNWHQCRSCVTLLK